MRILHTSDWHLGQHFIGKSRLPEHQKFINWLVDKVDEYQIDAIVIAGDVFDTGTPPSYARELYNQFIAELNQRQCCALILAGNHDSVATLNESRQLLSYFRTDVVTRATEVIEDQVLVLEDRQNEPGVIVCAVPFIRPRDVLSSQAGQSSEQKSRELGAAIHLHYQALFKQAESIQQTLQRTLGRKLPIMATGHLTAMGVQQTDSVRDIYIGSLEAFPASHFPPADYIALGHIHRPQTVSRQEHIRYCGSPIPLSFDELKWQKQVLLVEFGESAAEAGEDTASAKITALPVPHFQPMAALRGDLKQIEQALHELDDSELPVWLSIEVETEDYLSDLQSRIEKLVSGFNAEVLLLRRARKQTDRQINRQEKETLAELDPFEVFERRLAAEVFDDAHQGRLSQIRQDFAAIAREVAEEQGINLQRRTYIETEAPVPEHPQTNQSDPGELFDDPEGDAS